MAAAAPVVADSAPKRSAGEVRELRKDLTRIERRTEKLGKEEDRLHALLADAATSTDHEKVLALDAELRAVVAERETLEEQWLEIAADLE